MKRMIAGCVLGTLLAPASAWASDGYPRFVERDGLVCVQIELSDGTVEENCRPADREQKNALDLTPRRVGAGRALGVVETKLQEPAVLILPEPRQVALSAADLNADSWFGSGLASGLFLGLIGTVVVGVVASNSSVVAPPAEPRWTDTDKWRYEVTYVDAVQTHRSSTAIAGGLLGTGVWVLAALAIVNASEK